MKVRRISNKGAPTGTGLPLAETYEASGHQQVVVLLPKPADSGYVDLVVASTSHGVISHEQVSERVQVSVMIVLDTRSWPPGLFVLVIRHRDTWFHEIVMSKSQSQQLFTADTPVAATYRNGRGGRTPESKYVERSKTASVVIAGSIRGGTITYKEEALEVRFWHEMGDGTCLFYIHLPTPEYWEAATRTGLERRDEIVDFVAEAVSRKHAPGVKYSIARSQITYHAR